MLDVESFLLAICGYITQRGCAKPRAMPSLLLSVPFFNTALVTSGSHPSNPTSKLYSRERPRTGSGIQDPVPPPSSYDADPRRVPI